MADIEKWITINGAHIPIVKGESKARAVSNFIKGKKQARRKKMYDKYFDTADKATAIAAKKLELENEMKGGNIYTDDQIYWDSHDLGQEVADTKFERKYGKNWNKLSKHTIKGRAKTRDEIEDERFDKYDEYAHNAAKNIRFDNRKKPLSQDELYDRAHAVADVSSMYDMDYKYGKGGTHENKQVSINDKIREARYKMKTLTPREKRIAERENIRGKLKDANTIYADGKKFEKVTNGKYSFTEYKSGGINWGEDTLINRIQNSKKVKYKK